MASSPVSPRWTGEWKLKRPSARARQVAKFTALSLVGLALVLALISAALIAVDRAGAPKSNPRPTKTYAEAVSRVAELKARDGADILKPTIFLDRGSKVETAVVLFHGFTNNPEQFEQLGDAYRAAGYNVLIPRLPEHGNRDLMTKNLSRLTETRLAQSADEAVDIAAGLGNKVEVVGLSGGGVMAAWAATSRPEVTSATIISPLFGVTLMPAWAVKPIVAWSRVLPDYYLWWDPALKQGHKPADAYPRYSLRSISSFFDLGYDFSRQNGRGDTPLERAVLVTNAADRSVDSAVAKRVFRDRLGSIATTVKTFEYAESEGYAHDLIDPQGVNGPKTAAIYEKLMPLIGLAPDTTRTN